MTDRSSKQTLSTVFVGMTKTPNGCSVNSNSICAEKVLCQRDLPFPPLVSLPEGGELSVFYGAEQDFHEEVTEKEKEKDLEKGRCREAETCAVCMCETGVYV